MNPRGRWRRRRNFRRVPTTSASRRPTLLTELQTPSSSGPDFGHLPFRIPCKTPFLDTLFREIAFISALAYSKTGPIKKNTDKSRTFFGSSEPGRGPLFRPLKMLPVLGKGSQNMPNFGPWSPHKNPTNRLLRLASVVGTLLKLRLRRNKGFCIDYRSSRRHCMII